MTHENDMREGYDPYQEYPDEAEDELAALKEEAREAGYEEGYLDALNDIELRLGDFETIDKLRKMVTSRVKI